MAKRAEGISSSPTYEEEQDLFRFPDSRIALSREWADTKLLQERSNFG